MSYQPFIDPIVKQAQNVIFSTYGDVVSVDDKQKNLNKFGRNTNLSTTEETVWVRGGTETYASSNAIDTVSSSNAGDTQSIVVEGHTISGSDLTFVVQSATLNGQNKVVLTTPLARATRLYNNGSTSFAGTIYGYEDDTITAGVPNTSAKIHIQTSGTINQSLKCATALSSVDYWIITQMIVSVNKAQSRAVDFRLQIRQAGKVFRTVALLSGHSNSGTNVIDFNPALIAPKNSDVRVNAVSSGSSTEVSAILNGVLATIV